MIAIAAIQGASSLEIQALMRTFVDRLDAGVRLAGVIEVEVAGPTSSRAASELRSLSDDRRFPIFQDLGAGAAACAVDADGIVAACAAVQRDIAAGCDLVVLNKFGRLESERSGLSAAFSAAVEAGAPILTSVAPKHNPAWAAFAAPMFVILPPTMAAIEGWWRGVAPA